MVQRKTKTAKSVIKTVSKQISKTEEERYTLVKPELTFVEMETLNGIATGRDSVEMQAGIKLFNKDDSYHSVIKRLLRKFQAKTLAHCVYKATKAGVIS